MPEQYRYHEGQKGALVVVPPRQDKMIAVYLAHEQDGTVTAYSKSRADAFKLVAMFLGVEFVNAETVRESEETGGREKDAEST